MILIVCDAVGYADTAPYGATDVHTPALLRLAAEGARWTDAYAAAPTCAPSRAGLLTGRYPRNIGIPSNLAAAAAGLSREHPTLPRWLHDAGYRTALFGKWHLGSDPDTRPSAHGFDTWLGFDDWSIDYYTHLDDEGRPALVLDGEPVEREGYLTDLLSDAAVAFVRAHRATPFFVYLSYNAALPPYEPPGLPPSEWSKHRSLPTSSRADYAAMIEAMDHGIGRLLDTLDELDLAEDTLVVFTDDHGGRHFADPGPLFHGLASLWEGGIRVPLIVRWPRHLAPSSVITRPVVGMDVTASILQATGITAETEGMPLWNDRGAITADRQPRTLLWEIDRPRDQVAMRRGRWKLVIDEGTDMLFDLVEDPGEHHDRFKDHVELALGMRKEALQWRSALPGLGGAAPKGRREEPSVGEPHKRSRR